MAKRKAAINTKRKRGNPGKRHRQANHQRAKSDSATKTQFCLDLLSRAAGATIEEMQTATGWQQHSVRGFLAGTVKKKLGHEIASTKEERGRVYRIARAKDAT
jgi:hypothetical protein